jgi:hypothetical protein
VHVIVRSVVVGRVGVCMMCNKPKDLSVCDREERGRGEGGGVYDVCIR